MYFSLGRAYIAPIIEGMVGYVQTATTTAASGLPASWNWTETLWPVTISAVGRGRAAARAMRRERRGGDAAAEAPQAFKERASTLRNAQNRMQFSLFCGGVGG